MSDWNARSERSPAECANYLEAICSERAQIRLKGPCLVTGSLRSDTRTLEGPRVTSSQTSPTLGIMSTIELPEDVATALAAAAAQRGITEAELIAELVSDTEPDELDELIGVGASGQTQAFDIHAERAAAAATHDAATI